MILPLANQRDLRTQVRWGIRDFEHRFERFPEGMWLPETAVSTPVLEELSAQGIAFTILAPHQASRMRSSGDGPWQKLNGSGIDPTQPYTVKLPSGRSIVAFFYDGPIAQAVAFERLLVRGETFAERLVTPFDDRRERNQLVHIATDGETYGHHHRHGEMALAYALDYIESGGLARLTNYAEFLELTPPTAQAEVLEDTSWSCAHGVARWRSDCGCRAGRQWHQRWRAPLREALDWLRDEVSGRYEAAMQEFCRDPWQARDDYIDVILDRSPDNLALFIGEHARGPLDGDEQVRLLKLLELQRHAMLMYTSCGWFFDDISGIEAVQVIQYAARVVQLAGELFGIDLEPELVSRLGRAESNLRTMGDGGKIYASQVHPTIVGLRDVTAHYAVDSLFTPHPDDDRVYCFEVARREEDTETSGSARLLLGRVRMTSVITTEQAEMSYAILHMGDHNVSGGVRPYMGSEAFAEMVSGMRAAFERADFPAIIRLQDQFFGGAIYTLRSLFRDEQRHVLSSILDTTIADVVRQYRDVYLHYQGLMRSLRQFDYPLPTALRLAGEVVLHGEVTAGLASEEPDFRMIEELVAEGAASGIAIDGPELGLALQRAFGALAARLEAEPTEPGLLDALEAATELPDAFNLDVDTWQIQKSYYAVGHSQLFGQQIALVGQGDASAREWVEHFRGLGARLGVTLPD
jgi:hypothetical protein